MLTSFGSAAIRFYDDQSCANQVEHAFQACRLFWALREYAVCGFFGPREASVLGFRTSTGGHDAHWQADSSGQEAGSRARAVSRVSSARSMVPWVEA